MRQTMIAVVAVVSVAAVAPTYLYYYYPTGRDVGDVAAALVATVDDTANKPRATAAPTEQAAKTAPPSTGAQTGIKPSPTAQPQTAQPQTTQPQTAQPQTTQPQTTQPQTTQPQTAQPQKAQPQTAQPQTAQLQTAQPQTAQPQTAQPQTAQPQTAQPQTVQPQTVQPQTAQPQTAQPQTAQSQPTQPQKAQPKKAQLQTAQPQTAPAAKPSTAAAPAQPQGATPPARQTETSVLVAVAPRPKDTSAQRSRQALQLKSTSVAVASPPDQSKVPPTAAAAARPMPSPIMTPPSFDLVRVSKDCTAVIAGRAMSGSVIHIFLGGDKIAEAHADRRGEWVLVMDDPLPSGTLELSISAQVAGRPAISGNRAVVMVVPDCRLPQTERGPRLAVLTPDKGPKQGGATKILQQPTKGDISSKSTAAKAGELSVGSVDYDEKGNMAVSGTGKPGARVQAYVDNRYVGRANTDAHGSWRVVPERQVDPGIYRLRVDQVDLTGAVLARVELPFSRAAPARLAMLEDRVIVQPGNSLWRIARHTYGQGIQYSIIYEANLDQITDADLIYPGQIFILPTR